MKDQVDALVAASVPAAFINSSLSYPQYLKAVENAKSGKYKIIYIAPERLDSPDFLDFALNANVGMVTVDEAHCVSQWGQDFRPSYLKISEFIEKMPKRPVISCFTATATRDVREDIIRLMKLESPLIVTTGRTYISRCENRAKINMILCANICLTMRIKPGLYIAQPEKTSRKSMKLC
jgi:ATP-dependent DNA helicase RecQ